jgi:p-cumate 2,3-dioxygenase alpha subunit
MLRVNDLVIDRPEEELFAYHRSTMTSPEIFELEQERIFSKCWLYLGHESEVPNPGDYVRREIAGRPLFFARSRKTGKINVFYNTCTHRGATICRQDAGNGKSFQCFYHAWTFNMEGELIGVPDEESYGGYWDKKKMGLKSPRAENYRGFIFVNFNSEAEDLVTYLAGAREYIDDVVDGAEEGAKLLGSQEGGMEILKGTHAYAIKANWKLLAENSIDGYHVGPTHETYMTFLKNQGVSTKGGLSGGEGKDLGNGHAVMENVAPWGRPIAQWIPLFGEASKPDIERIHDYLLEKFGEERGRRMTELSRNLLVFPNLVINDIMAITVRTFNPIAPDHMEVTQKELAPKAERADLRALRLDSYLTFLGPGGFASPDDTEAMEACQQGFQAKEVEWTYVSRGFHHHPPRYTDEHHLRALWRGWYQRMTAEE